MEVKYIQVFFHAVLMRAFGNNHHTTLDEETESGLRDGLSVFPADSFQHGIREIIVASFGKRSSRHELCAVRLHHFLHLALLIEHMCFNLIYHRLDFYGIGQLGKPAVVEV